MRENVDVKRLLLVVADGVRTDVLREEIDAGRVPALADLAVAGGLYEVSTSFPSVTGPAYVPFIMGLHPANAGLPGLRWFDRTRRLRLATGNARSYAGIDIWHADRDVARDRPTILELARPSLAAMTMLARGASLGNVGRSVMWCIRAAVSHFQGDTLGWKRIEQRATDIFLSRFAHHRPRFSVLSITSPDKFAHRYGNRSDHVRDAIRDLDRAVAKAQKVALDGGWLNSLRIWLVGDHGHAAVQHHDDLHGWLESTGNVVMAHPKVKIRNANIALMVGGNAMAHLYLDPSSKSRAWWPSLEGRYSHLLEALLQRPSIDMAAVATDKDTVRVFSAARGDAIVRRSDTRVQARWDYVVQSGDPLQLGGTLRGLDECTAWQASADTEYPDSVVQLSSLVTSSRAGDIVVSAAKGWDLRARFEPVPHVSTHGALLREQMMVPLILDAKPARMPMRTTDVVPSMLAALGIASDASFDGRSFL